MTDVTNEELAIHLDAVSERKREYWENLLTHVDLREAARRVRLLDEYTPKEVAPFGTIDDRVKLLWYSSEHDEWFLYNAYTIRQYWRYGDLWLPLPKVQE